MSGRVVQWLQRKEEQQVWQCQSHDSSVPRVTTIQQHVRSQQTGYNGEDINKNSVNQEKL